jgi:hypothetical protein
MTQESGSSQPGGPRPAAGYPGPGNSPGDGYGVAGPGSAAPGTYGSNPYSAGPPTPGVSGYWGQPGPAGRRGAVNAVSIVQLAAGIAVLISLLLVWVDVSFSFLENSTLGSSTFVALAANSDGFSQTWLDLVLIGVAVALIAAIVNLSMREISRVASAVALAGFGLILVGAGYFLSAGMTWDYSTLSPGPGLYLCLVAAGIGALAAMAHLANPRLGTTRIAPAGQSGYWAAPPPWGGAAPHPADRAWPPQPLAPTYSAPTYPAPTYAVRAYAPAPYGSPAQIVVLEAGQSRMRSVLPGEQLLVGSDPEAQVCLADPAVQPRHAMIERRGDSWVVRDLQTASPSRLIDASGRIGPLGAEITLETGQLVIGSVLVTLYPGQR